MQKFMMGSLMFLVLAALQSNAFALTLDCKFSGGSVSGIKSIRITDEQLILNKDLEIPLEKSKVRCGHFGKQSRFDGMALGYQIVIKSCSNDADFEGHLLDSVKSQAAEVLCNRAR